jgi:hypothetical protein
MTKDKDLAHALYFWLSCQNKKTAVYVKFTINCVFPTKTNGFLCLLCGDEKSGKYWTLTGAFVIIYNRKRCGRKHLKFRKNFRRRKT